MGTVKSDRGIKHQNIYSELCRNILGGVYKPGQKLPTEKELSEHFHASRPTISRAMRELKRKGLIVRQQGRGTFVRQDSITAQKSLGILVHWQIWPDSQQAKHTTTIFGLMVPEMLRIASQFDYSLILNNIPEDIVDPVKRARQICKRLADSRLAGVFFTPLELTDESNSINEEIAAMLDNEGIAVVLLDRDISDSYHRSKYDIVGINNEQSALVLTHHLIDLGCTKIDFISGPRHTTSIVERIRGFRAALEENDIPFAKERVHLLESKFLDKAENEQVARELIRQVKDKQTEAFVCVNDDTAADIINFFLKNGIRVPEDVRIVGFDDIPTSQYLPISLTTIRQSVKALAAESVRTMLNRIEHPDELAREIMVNTELIVRDSCGSKL